ncbi:MAG: type I methionyl aminopeptidase, partial [Thermotogota bacterium]
AYLIKLKREKDIKAMEKASKIVGETLEMSRELLQPGITTWDIDQKIEEFIRNKGAIPSFKGYQGFPASACISLNEVLIHGIPSKTTILEEGDIVTIDVGVYFGGFHGDAARTYPIGKINQEKKRLIEITYQALELAIKSLEKASRLGEMGYEVQTFIENEGYSVIRDFGGHGIGREMHEDPFVPNFGEKNSGPKVRAGMTLAIEPMISMGEYATMILEDGWTVVNTDRSLNAHFEDDVAITEDGIKILSRV